MSLLTSFYSLSILFFIFTIYELINRDEFYFRNPNLQKPLKYLTFYYGKVCYWIWLIAGAIYTDLKLWFYLIIGFILFKFVIVLTKKNFWINLYDLIFNYILTLFALVIIFRLGFFQ
jgi:hypothetical protein